MGKSCRFWWVTRQPHSESGNDQARQAAGAAGIRGALCCQHGLGPRKGCADSRARPGQPSAHFTHCMSTSITVPHTKLPSAQRTAALQAAETDCTHSASAPAAPGTPRPRWERESTSHVCLLLPSPSHTANNTSFPLLWKSFRCKSARKGKNKQQSLNCPYLSSCPL